MNTSTLADLIGEGANINLVAEACLLGFGFQGLDLTSDVAVCCSSASESSRVRASSFCSSSHAYALSFFSNAA